MTGDQDDMVARLSAVLPSRWFSDAAPLLSALLAGLGAAWAWVYGMAQFVKAQTRIGTASGVWLDVIALDCFGGRYGRGWQQSDDRFRAQIKREILRERGTRNAVSTAVADLTGRTPDIFEPSRAADTGAWNVAIGYGRVGGWGSLNLPFQFFVHAYRPHAGAIALVAGWGSNGAGYGKGAIQYGNLSMIEGQVTDGDINAAIAGVLPVSTTAWTQITA